MCLSRGGAGRLPDPGCDAPLRGRIFLARCARCGSLPCGSTLSRPDRSPPSGLRWPPPSRCSCPRRAYVARTSQQHNVLKEMSFDSPSKDVLMYWVSDNLMHPFPTYEQKQALAKSTGLTIKQVSDWFCNFRKRKWAHMVCDFMC